MKKTVLAMTVLTMIGLAATASAALLVEIVNIQTVTNDTLDADLTALGAADWVIWDAWSGGIGVIYDRKSGGSGIGALTYSGGHDNAVEINGSQGMRFDYSDGATHTGTQTDINEGIGRIVRNSGGPHSISLTVDLAGPKGHLDLFISGNNRVLSSTLTATIGTESGSVNPGWDYVNRFYQYRVNFSGATAGDILDIHWETPNGSDWNSRMIVNAGALYIVPEPSVLALLGIGGLLMLSRRRV